MWIIVTLASLAVILILVLCVPLDLVLHTDVYGRPKFRLRMSWLFGLVSKEVTKGKKKPEEKKKEIEGKQKPGGKRRRTRFIFEILRTKGLLRQTQDLLREVLRRIKIRDLAADFRVGLDNPADTGLLFALIGPATFLLSSFFPHRIRVQPSFGDEAVFEGHLHGAVRVQPIQLVTPFLRFAFSLATIRVIKRVVLTKWEKRGK